MKRRFPVLLLIPLILLVTACERKSTVCATQPPDVPVEIRQSLEVPSNADGDPIYPIDIKILNRTVSVDKIVHGPLCDDDWSGLVYVDCDVEVPEWDRDADPTFFDDCNLNIEPGTTVYVAYHNDTAYYKGCSCHSSTGELQVP